jgi:hypothetical protein
VLKLAAAYLPQALAQPATTTLVRVEALMAALPALKHLVELEAGTANGRSGDRTAGRRDRGDGVAGGA